MAELTEPLKTEFPLIVLLVGLPGSGKSTWLKSQNIQAISSDEIRILLTGNAANQTVNKQVFFLLRMILRLRLRTGQPVTYVDATNLTRWERQQYIRIARKFQADTEVLWFNVPLEVSKERNRLRERVVPDEVMDYLAGRFEEPNLDEGLIRIRLISEESRITTF